MKRVKSACICQTIHFMLKDGISSEENKSQVAIEVERYKKGMDKNSTKYKIVSEEIQEDGSVIIVIKKQYNQSPVGNYLD